MAISKALLEEYLAVRDHVPLLLMLLDDYLYLDHQDSGFLNFKDLEGSRARPGLDFLTDVSLLRVLIYFPYDECCYHPTRGYLIENPIPGAGRVHLYHPGNPSTIREFEEEEAAYNDCCSEPNNVLCGAFYWLRPVCTSDGWALTRPRWGKSDHWRSQPDNLVPLCKFQSITIIHFFRN